VTSRAGLWAYDGEVPVVTGLQTDRPEVLITSMMDTRPVYRHEMPEPTYAPLIMAVVIAGMLASGIFTPWGVVVGSFALVIPYYIWAWPDRGEHARNLREERQRRAALETAS
jgi:hypothetical protein